MKVTPIGKPFGKYKPGDEFELKDVLAKVYIGKHKLQQVYKTRALVAEDLQTKQQDVPEETAEVTEAAESTEAAGPELDSAGTAWDAETHTSTKLKNSDGTWRKKPGRASA
jgi:hypothetical protein